MRSVRIVATAQVPSQLPFAQPKGGTKEDIAAAGKRNRAVVASSRVGDWLPSYQIKRPGRKAPKKHALVQCRNVRRPVGFSGLGLLTVLTVDLSKGLEPVDSVAVMTDGRIVYASPESLYVATERWADRPPPDKPTQEQDGVKTAIHKFDISSPDADPVSRQRRRLRLPAQPVVAVRVQRRPARRQHRVARVVGARQAAKPSRS